MGGFEVKREDAAGRVVLRLSGTFDESAARALKRVLSAVDPGRQTVIDFSRVRDFQDVTVNVLARALAERPVQLRGLGTHQARMFEYFGIPAGESDDRAYYTPEEILVA